MVVVEVTEASDNVRAALDHLLPQLKPTLTGPSADLLERAVTDPVVTLLVATVEGAIVGTATVAVIPTPSSVKAYVNDVVVDDAERGHGVGRALLLGALEVAKARGARTLRLTSAARRAEAHALYESLGFRDSGDRAFRLEL